MSLVVERATSARQVREAEAFVLAHPLACFGVDTRWRDAIRDTYSLPELLLVARRGRQLVGVAPWHLLWTPLAGAYLCGAPFASYGGPLAEDGEARGALLEASARHARRLFCAHIQWKELAGHPAAGPSPGDEGRFVSPFVDVSAGEEALWSRTLLSRARQFVRKARRLGVTVNAWPALETFASVFDSSMRALGSPFHGLPFFRALRRRFGPEAFFLVAFAGGRPAAAALGLVDRGVMHYVYGASVRELRPTCANTALLWELMRTACRLGLRGVDLGRSERGGSHDRFKGQWGPATVPLRAVTIPVWRRSAVDLAPTNPAFGLAQRAWSALPLPVTRRLGPLLIRGIG